MRHTLLLGFVAPLLAAVPLWAQTPAQAPAPMAAPAVPEVVVTETLDTSRDRTERMTVPVSIDGRGPYRFIVDTGSERTVISRELARALGLDRGRTATVYSMTEVSRIDTVVIPALEVGRRTVTDIHAPALDRHDLGAEGLLGVDTLRSQRVELDFVRQVMSVTPSRRRERAWPSDAITVTARSRYGHLMLVDASFEGERVYVIVDTGSQVTVANNALRRRLERRRKLGPLHPVELLSVTGGTLAAEYGVAREIRIGEANIRNLPVAFAEVAPFVQLRLSEHPAILLGMDALRLFDRVSFDFANRRVRMLPRPAAAREPPVRMAGRAR
jgi:predicted aspartyl protease